MPEQWLVKRPYAIEAPPVPPEPASLPHPILGTPVVTTAFGTDENHQFLIDVTIPVSWPGGDADGVTKLIVYLLAPDNTTDTQESFVGGPGAGGTVAGQEVPGIVIGDAANASKVVTLNAPEFQVEQDWDATRPHVHFTHQAPTTNEWWRVIVVSANKTQNNKVETSPYVRIPVTPHGADVSGVEYAPLALNLTLVGGAPRYETIEGGVPTWGFAITWENDTKDPRYAVLGGYDVVIEYPNGNRESHASKSANDTRHESNQWTFGAAANFTVWLVSYSSQTGNRRNSIVTGLTPHVTFRVELQTGPPGGEYSTVITGFHVANAYYGKNAQGQKTLYLPFLWNKPTDPAYTGAQIWMIRENGSHYQMTGLEAGTSATVQLNQYPTTPENVTFYILSVSNAHVNTYQPGVTPSISFTMQPPPDTTPDVISFTASVSYEKDEFGNNAYGYSGSWINPNKGQYPEYQGVKIIKAKADRTERQDLTGIETGQSFKTSRWPVPKGGESAIYLYAVSVDVNGVERPLSATTPRAGPLFITEQGGTIDNEHLPELDVANFAAGVEPVTYVNSVDTDGDGFLQGVAKQTTTVYNQADWRLYRWQVSTGSYKVVGNAQDLDANSVTTGKLAAGSVTSLQMAGREILVGPLKVGETTDMRPPIFKVETATSEMVGFFGTYSGWEGIYAKNARFGPSFASPTFESSAAGVTINNATFTISKFNVSKTSSVIIDPAVFDSTYGSLAVRATDSNGMEADLVSRGVVCYQGGLQVAAIVRSSNLSVFAGEVTVYNNQSLVIHLEGPSGLVRAQGFQILPTGEPGVDSTVTYLKSGGGAGTMVFKKGILISSL